MSQPETNFYNRVNKRLPSLDVLHREKMSDPYRKGRADFWYSAIPNDLWVEYKYNPKLPARDTSKIEVDLSESQLLWLNRRYGEGRSVAVVVGLAKAGGIILTAGSWNTPHTLGSIRPFIVSVDDIARFIIHRTLGGVDAPKVVEGG